MSTVMSGATISLTCMTTPAPRCLRRSASSRSSNRNTGPHTRRSGGQRRPGADVSVAALYGDGLLSGRARLKRVHTATALCAKATLHLPSGKSFRIKAENLGSDRQYIASVTLNGVPLDRLFLRLAEILAERELRFTMSDNAHARWSVQPHQLPYSMTPVHP
jgi:hypothetical protein